MPLSFVMRRSSNHAESRLLEKRRNPSFTTLWVSGVPLPVTTIRPLARQQFPALPEPSGIVQRIDHRAIDQILRVEQSPCRHGLMGVSLTEAIPGLVCKPAE